MIRKALLAALLLAGCAHAPKVARYPVIIEHRGYTIPGWLEAYPDSMRDKWIAGQWRKEDGEPLFMPFGVWFQGWNFGTYYFSSPLMRLPTGRYEHEEDYGEVTLRGVGAGVRVIVTPDSTTLGSGR